jgi:hypothetical protein
MLQFIMNSVFFCLSLCQLTLEAAIVTSASGDLRLQAHTYEHLPLATCYEHLTETGRKEKEKGYNVGTVQSDQLELQTFFALHFI